MRLFFKVPPKVMYLGGIAAHRGALTSVWVKGQAMVAEPQVGDTHWSWPRPGPRTSLQGEGWGRVRMSTWQMEG